jgi:6-phosphofructokinase 2
MRPRLLTLTLNPAVDLASTASKVEPTHKIRTRDEHIDPGGGGINVSRVLHAVGEDTLALVLCGGVTGHLIQELLDEAGVPREVFPMQGRTRISMTVHDDASGHEYRFVPEGPLVSDAEWHAVLAALEREDGEWLIASGSVPRGMPADIYAQVARIAARRGQRFVLDTSGAALHAAMYAGIDLMKPSLRELESLVGHTLETKEKQAEEAMALVRAGAARMIAVTLGAEGAILATESGVFALPALPGPVRSAVGAGDAFLAGMVRALARGHSPESALGWGIATGTASVACIGTARVTAPAVEAEYRRMEAMMSTHFAAQA